MLCRFLISEGITFDEFESAIKEILSRFPNAKGWLNWYLHPHRACHLFPACNQSDLHDGMSDKFIKQSKDILMRRRDVGFSLNNGWVHKEHCTISSGRPQV